MSDKSKLVYVELYKEYQDRLKQGMNEGCNTFSKDSFFSKFNYSDGEIEEILDELKYYGYIEKWINDYFALKID